MLETTIGVTEMLGKQYLFEMLGKTIDVTKMLQK
jgi:hypothetical protein